MNPTKILVIKLRAMGDTVLMTAPLLELRSAYPRAEIHALVLSPWAPLLEGFPAINRLWTYERHSEMPARAKALARLALRLRKERYDIAAVLHASPTSATLGFATGAKIRSIHFHGHRDKNRYSTVIVPGKGVVKPIIERDMDTIRALGVQIPEDRYPRLPLSEAEKKEAALFLSKMNLSGPVLGIGLGASRPTKRWPLDRMASVAVSWCERTRGGVLALAGPQELQEPGIFMESIDDVLCARIQLPERRAVIRSRISVQKDLPVRRLSAVLSQLPVFLGNDSGPKHLAVAVDTPTVTLFGPEHPLEWHPYRQDRHSRFFIENLACRRDAEPGMPAWCGLQICVEERHRCMRLIGEDEVLAACLKVAGH